MSREYRVVFGSSRIEKEIVKFLERLPRSYQQKLHDAMAALGNDPWPQQAKGLSVKVEVFSHTARYRLRVGDYRILYDVDDEAGTVVIVAVRRRSEKTYH